MSDFVQELLDQGDEAVNLRKPYDPLFDDIARIMAPTYVGFSGRYEPGLKTWNSVRDSSPLQAIRRFVSIMAMGVTPRNSHWHDLGFAEDPELINFQPVRKWTETLTTRLYGHRYRAGSGFDTCFNLTYLMEGVFGTAIIYKDSQPGGLRMRYQALPLRECYPVIGPYGENLAMFRRFEWTARSIVAEWPEARKIAKIAQSLASRDSAKFRIQHSVVKREVYNPTRLDSLNKPWQSVYLLMDEKQVIRESGYDDFPFLVGRLIPSVGLPYGEGLGWAARPDVKELNQMVATTTRGAMKRVDPPNLTSPAFDMDRLNMNPGAMNRGGLSYRGDELVKSMRIESDTAVGLEMQNQRREQVNETWMNDVFQLLKQFPEMTAYEVRQRIQRSNALFVPMIGQQETDLFGPLISWEVKQVLRDMPPMPPELVGKTLIPIYQSPLLKVVRSEEAEATARIVEFFTKLAGVGMPGALDIIDEQEAFRAIADGWNVPAKALRSRMDVARKQEARAAANAQQDQLDQAEQVATAAGKASPALAAMANMQQQSNAA